MTTVIDAIRSLVSIFQKDRGEMSRYETRLSSIRDITVAKLGGDIIIHEMWGRHEPKSSIRVLGENDDLSMRYGLLLSAQKQEHSCKQDILQQ